MNIALLQEIRLAGSGSRRGKDDPFFWQGKGPDNLRIHGIGFTVKNSLLSSVKPSDKGSECLLTCRLHTSKGQVTLVYTPKLLSTPEAKDEFYKKKKKKTHTRTHTIPSQEQLVLLGSFNARVGANNAS